MLDQIKQLGAQFGFLKVMLGVMAGTAKPKSVQDWIVTQINEDDGKNLKYKDLTGEDKEGVDAIVATFTALSGVFDEVVDAKAAMCFKFFKSLQKAGFDEASALRIVASQGVDMMKANKE